MTGGQGSGPGSSIHGCHLLAPVGIFARIMDYFMVSEAPMSNINFDLMTSYLSIAETLLNIAEKCQAY